MKQTSIFYCLPNFGWQVYLFLAGLLTEFQFSTQTVNKTCLNLLHFSNRIDTFLYSWPELPTIIIVKS